MNEQNILVIGSHGLLGSTLVKNLQRAQFKVKTSDIADVDGIDITSKASILHHVELWKPSFVVNCAAYTNVEACEDPKQYEIARKVNATALKYLGEVCREKNVGLIHISTDYVFGENDPKGYTEDHTPYSPLNKYGQTKAEGEANLIELYGGLSSSDFVRQSPLAYIVRTSALFGQGATNFIAKILQFAREKEFLEVVTDEVVSPTYVEDLSKGIIHLIEHQPKGGIYHFSGEGSCTRNEFAKEILRLSDISTPVKDTTLDKFNREAKIPNISILINTKFPKIRKWEEMLRDFLKEELRD